MTKAGQKKPEAPIIAFASPKAWEKWLAANHAASAGIWMKLAKKASGVASVTYPEAVEGALIWGWIDGQKKPLDDAFWLQKFTPRGPRSLWSAINRGKIEALTAAGRMKPPGLREVERAKADGRWESAYGSAATIAVPDDLAAALAKRPKAKATFEALRKTWRYSILFRVHTAKKPETRARRIADFVERLAAGDADTLFKVPAKEK